MTFPRARVTVAAGLFLAWLGFLLYLVLATRHTVILSRPQLLAADLLVRAGVSEIDGKPATTVKVLAVLRYNVAGDLKLVGHELEVDNLPAAAKQGFTGPGEYLLPLEPVKQSPKGRPFTKIQQVPAYPGFEPAYVKVQLWSAGKQPEQAIQLAVEYLGVAESLAKERIEQLVARETPSITLARGVPRGDAVEFIHRLHEADPGADAGLLGDDIRIYPWTPETKAQVEEFLR